MKKEYSLSFFLTILIFILNYSFDTMLHYTPEQWESVVKLHLTGIPFRLRPFTNYGLMFFYDLIGLSKPVSFYLQQYILLFGFFVSLAHFFKAVQFDERKRIAGLIITAVTYPILCVHFIPNFTWDNIWLYIGLIWFGYFLVKQKFYIASLFLLFATISHESALFVIVSFYFFRDSKKSWQSWILPAMIPVVIYLALRLFVYPNVMTGRFDHFAANFKNADAVRQTIYSILISFGWLWGTVVWGLFQKNKIKHRVPESLPYLYSSAVISLIPISSILFVGLARETRLFYGPFLFVITFALLNAQDFFKHIVDFFRQRLKLLAVILAILIFTLTMYLTVKIFPSFIYLPYIDIHRVYFALHLSLILFMIAVYFFRKRENNS